MPSVGNLNTGDNGFAARQVNFGDVTAAEQAVTDSGLNLALAGANQQINNNAISETMTNTDGQAEQVKSFTDGQSAAAAAYGGTASNISKNTFGVANAVAGAIGGIAQPAG